MEKRHAVSGDVLVPNVCPGSYVYPSAVASDTTQLFHWINSASNETRGSYV
jgi:hypothetical protein